MMSQEGRRSKQAQQADPAATNQLPGSSIKAVQAPQQRMPVFQQELNVAGDLQSGAIAESRINRHERGFVEHSWRRRIGDGDGGSDRKGQAEGGEMTRGDRGDRERDKSSRESSVKCYNRGNGNTWVTGSRDKQR